MIRYNKFHRVNFLNSSNVLSGKIYEDYSDILEYFALRKLNDELAAENAHLKSELLGYLGTDNMESGMRKINEDSVLSISAKVINNSVNKQYNYITLNRGRKDGVKPDMGVICSDGIVGLIINVSENYSTALSVLNGRWSINAKLADTQHFGPLHWEGVNPYIVVLDEIPYHVRVQENEKVLTSGYSAVFPEDIQIGKVVKVIHNEGETFQEIWVQLSTDFKNLFYVEIIENLNKQEQLNLEKETQDE